MKFYFILLMFLLCIIMNSGNAAIMKCSIAAEQNQGEGNETIFIDSSQIHFSGDEIFVTLNNEMLPVNSLCGNYRGIFIEYKCGVGYWVCPRCTKKNELWDYPYCQHCPYVCPK
ncbi:hypothetical protein [Parachlamydia acanthamoebae]|uniref:hypothetical protein n=1 Tax=Parachlamydia acanthamoebae TaxID=83552 RepID=UPI000561D49D|nr:hypothetical protein [Parachlamydia acanthamoebae]